MLFYIVFIIVCSCPRGTIAGYDCVERCSCKAHGGMAFADCSHSNWTRVPQPTIGSFKVEILHLEDNNIRQIHRNYFTNYADLHELNFTQNELEAIGSTALAALTSLRKLDLSCNKLRSIARREITHVKYNLTWLSVADNLLEDAPEGLADFHKLDYLDISGNAGIDTIRTDELPQQLKELNLERTGIIRLDGNALGKQKQITKIHLGNMNHLETVELSNHGHIIDLHEAFITLPSLKKLIIRNCHVDTFPALVNHSTLPDGYGFPPNVSPLSCNITSEVNTIQWYNPLLQTIDLSENPELSILPGDTAFAPSILELRLRNTKIVEPNFMKYAQHVKVLDLHNTNIMDITKDTLSCLRNLEEIWLSENKLDSLPDLPQSSRILHFNHMRIQNITDEMFENLGMALSLDLSDNDIHFIEDAAFARMTSLQHLNLSGHAMPVIRQNMLLIGTGGGFSSLENLDMSRGSLRVIESSSLSTHHGLKKLILSDNALINLGNKTLEGLINVQVLDFRRNDILNICDGAFSSNSKLQVLHLEHNRIHILLSGALRGLESLQELYLQFNELSMVQKYSLPALRVLDLSRNRLKSIPDIGGENMTVLNASSNPLTQLDGAYFQSHQKLQLVNLSFCNVNDIHYTDVFGHTTSLQALDLTGNDIKSLPNVHLPFITELYIGGNDIHEISEKHAHYMKNLTFVRMTNTNFNNIDPEFFNTLQNLNEFDINGSYLPCTCALRAFGAWANTHKNIVTGLLFCHMPPESVEQHAIPAINALDCPQPTNHGAVNQSSIYIGISVTIVVVLLILIIFLIRACRKRNAADEYEMQQTGESEPSGFKDKCCKCMAPLKCCLQARENVYSRSRMRLFSNEESEFAVSPLDKDVPVA